MKKRTLVEISAVEAGTTTTSVATFTMPLGSEPLKRNDVFRKQKKGTLIKEIDTFLFGASLNGKK